MSKNNLPTVPSEVSTHRAEAQVVPIGAGAAGSLGLNPDAERIRKLAWAIDGLMPKHRLSEQDIGAAAAAVEMAANGYGKLLIEEFAERTTLTPGIQAYNRAEFRNVIFALYMWARGFNGGKRAPALLALYWFYSSAGVGPHPRPDFWQKLSKGLSTAERSAYQRDFVNWRDHLHRRRQLVLKALDRRSVLSERQRKSILGADPLIADILR
jgi:hypothetical protein